MAGSLLPQPNQLFQTASWGPGVNYQINTYEPGTLTRKDTFEDAALTIANTNPVIVDARGEVTMYGSGLYRIIVTTPGGATIYDRDNVPTTGQPADALQTLLAASASTSNGAGLIGLALTLAYGSGTVGGFLRGLNHITKYGAINNDGSTDDALTFQAAAASGDRFIDARGVNCRINSQVDIPDNQIWLLQGASFTIASSTQILFSAVGADDWALLGPFNITGDGSTVGTAAGIYIAGCNRFRVDQPTIRSIKGWGIKHDPGSPSGTARGDQGQIIAPQLHDCYYGFENTAGTGAEYCTLIAPMITGCTFPAVISAGNTTITGGNIVDNTNGLFLGSGSNHAHGIISGVNISHNTNYNISASAVTLGQTFVGCHVYGDSLAGAGKILLTNSKGINFVGGQIDAMIQNDGTTGPNYLSGVMFPGAYTTKAGANIENLYFDRCVTMSGPSALNDAAPVYVFAARSTDQSLTAGGVVTAIMDSESVDNRNAYNNTTGVFTVPTPGTQLYEVNVFFTITAASGLTSAGSYVEVRNAAGTAGYIPVTAVSATLAVASGSVSMAAANAAEIDVMVAINGGAGTPVLSASVSKQTIKLVS